MQRAGRIAVAVGLTVIGVLLALFFLGVLAVADCSRACVERGERSQAFAVVGLGVGLAVAGVLYAHLGPRRAIAWGLGVGGVVGAAGASLLSGDARIAAAVWVALAVGIGAGAALRNR